MRGMAFDCLSQLIPFFRTRSNDTYGFSSDKVVEKEEFFDAWDRTLPAADK
jgi:hypothetical protein